MNKRFTKLIAALALLVFMTPSLAGWGQTYTQVAELDMTTKAYGNSSYNSNLDYTTNDITWNIVYGANNNKGWAYFKMGGKSTTISDYNPCYIYNKTAITQQVDKVTVHLPAGSLSKSGMSVNSWGLYVYSNSDMTTQVDYVAGGTITNSEASFDFTPSTGVTWASGYYYKVSWDLANTTTTNGIVCVDKITLFKEAAPSYDPTLSVDPESIAFGEKAINTTNTETFTVTYANLTEDLTVAGFEGITVTPTTIEVGEGTGEATVTVTYAPTAVGSINGSITVSNTDDEVSKTVTVTGSAYDPANVDTYELYTGNIVEGDYVIYDASVAMKNEIVSNRFANQAVEPEENQIINPANSIIWHIASSGDYWTIYNAAVGKYAGGTSTKNQGALLDDPTDNLALWTITYSNGFVFHNYGRSLASSDSGNAYLKHNSNNGWATYASGTGGAPILYKKVNANQVAMPAFNPAAGTYTQAQTVELSCATEGATIQYKLTENGDWQTYSSALTISETTTVWAKATKEGMDESDVASATYTIELPLSTIPAIFNAASSTSTNVNVTFGNWVVSGVNGSNVYVTDNNGNGFIIYTSSHGFTVNNKLSGTVYETPLKLYKGSAEFTNLTSSTEGLTVSTDGEITVITDKAIADLGGVNTGAVITLSNLTYDGTNLSDGTNTIKPYNSLYSDMSFTTGNTYNVTGVYMQFDDTKEILPRSADDIEELAITIPVINATTPETLAYDATSGEIEYSISNPVDGVTLSATTEADWISNMQVGDESVTFTTTVNDGNSDRTATITLSYTGATDKVVTVTQAHYVADYATLPFEFDGGRADIANTAGLTQENLGTDYSSSPKLKFNNDNSTISTLVLKINETPGTLSFDIKGNSFSGGTFKVQTSVDGETYTDLKTYTELGDKQSEEFNNVAANVRYIKWIYTEKSLGNVALGNIKLEKAPSLAITGYGTSTGGYYLVASPVTTTPAAAGMITTESDYDLYYFDDTQDLEWINYKADENGGINAFDLEPGKGYLYANSSNVTLTFAGEPYAGDGQVPVIAGWNLVGNPFGDDATLNAPFYRMNEGGAELSAEIESGNTVNAMEGVFVNATEAGNVTFSTSGNSKGQNIALNLSRNDRSASLIDRAIVRFDEGQQLPKFQLNPENTKLYIAQGNKDYAIVRSAAQGEMPVSFRASANGTYTLSIEAENVEMDYLHLIDNMTGADVDLLQTPSYTFEATTRDYASRFRLVFSANETDGPSTGSGAFAYFNGSEWQISNVGEATLQVVDVMGRTLSSQTISGNANVSINQPAGIYMLRLVNGNDVKVQKVVVR